VVLSVLAMMLVLTSFSAAGQSQAQTTRTVSSVTQPPAPGHVTKKLPGTAKQRAKAERLLKQPRKRALPKSLARKLDKRAQSRAHHGPRFGRAVASGPTGYWIGTKWGYPKYWGNFGYDLEVYQTVLTNGRFACHDAGYIRNAPAPWGFIGWSSWYYC
jgi:hypothetical protein